MSHTNIHLRKHRRMEHKNKDIQLLDLLIQLPGITLRTHIDIQTDKCNHTLNRFVVQQIMDFWDSKCTDPKITITDDTVIIDLGYKFLDIVIS